MIFASVVAQDPESQLVMTISEVPGTGKFVKVAITEEEMFRAILGDEEFERRRAIAYEEDWKEKCPAPPKPPEVAQAPIAKKRYIELLKKAEK